MRRWLITFTFFPLAGAAVNIAVAWGCVFWAPPEFRGTEVSHFASVDHVLEWPRQVPDNWIGPEVIETSRSRYHTLIVASWSSKSRGLRDHSLEVVQWGWPFRALEFQIRLTTNPPDERMSHRAGIVGAVPDSWMTRNRGLDVPGLPLWPGFAANTALYAAILWALIPGPFVLRRAIRKRRGLCLACGYPRGNSAVCTECGITLPKRAVA
jgi:hypothetical protein